MKIEIRTSGGFGGIAVKSVKTVDTGTLPSEDRPAVETMFSAGHLEQLSGAEAPGGAADMAAYSVTVTGDDGERRTFEIPENAIPPEMLDVIDRF
jgi:hypothetical protein